MFEKNDENRQVVSLKGRIVDAMNRTPVDYVHSARFVDEGKNAFENARKKLAKIPINNLCEDVLDPGIDSDTQDEIVYGKKQYIKHLGAIDTMIDSAVEEVSKAELAITLLEQDKAKLEAERDRLLGLR